MTTTSSTLPCPHCSAVNPSTAAFCESCGKALPAARSTGPRIIGADEMPTTGVGHQLVSDELRKTQKSASTAVLVVAIIQTIVAGLLMAAVMFAPAGRPMQLNAIGATILAVAVLFWGLWFWSRVSPLPATIVALIAYSTLVALNVVLTMQQIAANPQGVHGIGIGILDIVIIAVLVRAIAAGVKHKRLMAAAPGAGM